MKKNSQKTFQSDPLFSKIGDFFLFKRSEYETFFILKRKSSIFIIKIVTMTKQQILEEAARRFTFNLNYDPAKPRNYPTLREIKGGDATVFNHELLKEMREGRISPIHPIFEALPNVRDILQLNEAYDTFSEFMSKLRTDTNSVKNSNNVIRRVFQDFMKRTPQRWKLIDPDEYLRCMQQFSHTYVNPLGSFSSGSGFEKQRPQFGAEEDYWAPRIYDWIANIKDNIAQLAANSFLVSGPTVKKQKSGRVQYDPRATNERGELTLNRLWFDLSGDKKIPLTNDEYQGPREKYFNRTYWTAFTEYIGTDFGDTEDGSGAFETDSPLDGAFDIVAEFDKNYSDPKKLFGVLDRIKNLAHGRGSFAHLIIKGGKEACSKITNS